MQKLTGFDLHMIVSALENAAEEDMQMAKKIENHTDRVFIELKAQDLYSIAQKLRLALENEDKRIAIV